jgi:Uma2 family endonuclease
MGVIEATPENWWSPPQGGWTYDQVKTLQLPFDWELVDGLIAARGQTALWHDTVRGELFLRLRDERSEQPLVSGIRHCVMVDTNTVIRPDLVIYDKRGLDPFTQECLPAPKLKLVVEVVSPTSQRDDRVGKPSMMADAGVPYFWRIERGKDHVPVVHEFWLNHDTGSYIPAPQHPVHKGKLISERPFPVEIDLRSLIGRRTPR